MYSQCIPQCIHLRSISHSDNDHPYYQNKQLKIRFSVPSHSKEAEELNKAIDENSIREFTKNYFINDGLIRENSYLSEKNWFDHNNY